MGDPNNIVMHDWKTVFLLSTKAANSSVKTAILEAVGQRVPVKERQRHVHRHRFFKSKYISAVDASKLKGYTKVGFVRNPWDRALSLYIDKVRDGNSGIPKKRMKLSDQSTFPEFVRTIHDIPDRKADIHFLSQCANMVDSGGNLIADLIIRFESLDIGWNELRQRIKIDLPDLPKTNTTKHRDFREYYDSETRQMVAERYANDIKMFGYEF